MIEIFVLFAVLIAVPFIWSIYSTRKESLRRKAEARKLEMAREMKARKLEIAKEEARRVERAKEMKARKLEIAKKEEEVKRLSIILEIEEARKFRVAAERKKREKAGEYFSFLEGSITKHIDDFLRKRAVLVRQGDYGEILVENWFKELNQFLSVVDPQSRWRGVERNLSSVINFLDQTILTRKDNSFFFDENINELSGVEFEVHCGSLLENQGWKVIRTAASGDQGVDLIAEKNGRRIAIQCKRHSSSIGNSAVQEAYTGMGYYDANEAIVVSNNSYTKSAQEVAYKLDVRLLHYRDLSFLDGKDDFLVKNVKQSNVKEQYDLGVKYEADLNYTQAFVWYEKAAFQGYAEAQNRMGKMYDKGLGVEQDYTRAFAWYEKAAEKGYSNAQIRLGEMYDKGLGVNLDYLEAEAWYEKAAEKGCAVAQASLGELYIKDRGYIPKNYKKALIWFEKAADQGNPKAQYNIGMVYFNGQGVHKDYLRAAVWFEKAADQGNLLAQQALGLMYKNGTGICQNYVKAKELLG